MKMKGIFLVTFFLIATLTVSGCVGQILGMVSGGADCEEFQSKLEGVREGVSCDCYPTSVIPEEIKKRSPANSDCYCICSENSTKFEMFVTPGDGVGLSKLKEQTQN